MARAMPPFQSIQWTHVSSSLTGMPALRREPAVQDADTRSL